MKTEQVGASYLALPDAPGPHPGVVVVVHEAGGLNDNIRDICRRLATQGYGALGVELFAGFARSSGRGQTRISPPAAWPFSRPS